MSIILPNPELVDLGPVTAGEPARHRSTVIVVPDIGKPRSAKTWIGGASAWFTSNVPGLICEPRILEFRYTAEQGTTFSWELLLHCGDSLLKELLLWMDDSQDANDPLIFICHGLGGTIAKRAIGVLHSQYYRPRFHDLIKIVRGFIFLGTPHPLLSEPQHWTKLASFLRAKTKLSKDVIDGNASQVSLVARISQLFAEPASTVSILTIIERKATNTGLPFRPSKQTIVDEEFARIGSLSEIIIESDAAHSDLCNAWYNLSTHVMIKFFQDAEKPIQARSSSATALENDMADWTVSTWDKNDFEPLPSSQTSDNTMLATAGLSDVSRFEFVPLGQDQDIIADRCKLPLHMLKPHVRNPQFYGRENVLQTLKEKLLPIQKGNSSTASGLESFALCGPGGLGKTQTAVEFAYRSTKSFDAILLLQASDTGKLAQSYTEIAELLGLDHQGSIGDQLVCKELVLEWLSNPTWSTQRGTRQNIEMEATSIPTWLLIFDNADDLDVLRDYWPVSGCGSILITSRDPLAKTRARVPVATGLDLPPFQPEEGGGLLRNLTGYVGNENEALSAQISGRLTGLPLAIAQIAGTISRRDLGFAEFVELFDKESHRAELLQFDSGTVPKTLYTVWAFEDLSSAACSLLNIIAFLDPDQIPEALLQNMEKVPERDRCSPLYPLSTLEYIKARSELAQSSLIKRNQDRKELIIHRIIQDTSRARMGVDTLQATFETVAVLLYVSWPFSHFDHRTERWIECEPLVHHIGNIARYYEENALSRTSAETHTRLAALIMENGWYYFERGNIPRSLPFFNLALKICDLQPNTTQVTAGDVWGCLAQIASTTNDPENAIKHAKRSVEIFETHGIGTFRLPQSYNELAEAYIAAGRWEEAVEQTDLAIQGYLALPKLLVHHPDWAMMNKGLALRKLGRYEEASEVLETFLEFREKTFGPMDNESFKTGQGFMFLAKVRSCQDRIPECLDLYLKTLAQYHSTIGTKHFRVAAVCYDLGCTYIVVKEPDQAVLMFEKALEIYDDRADFSAEIARVYMRRAEAQIALERFSEAEQSKTAAIHHKNLLSVKIGRNIDIQDLEKFIPNWSS